MEEKRNHFPAPKKRYSTISGSLIQIGLKIILLSLVAWLLLLAWFVGELIFSNNQLVNMHLVNLFKINQQFISSHPNHVFIQLNHWVNDMNTAISQLMTTTINKITTELEKINFKFEKSILDISTTIASMIAGTIEIMLGRLLIFIMNLPLLLSLLFLAVVDGLVQRDKRKFQAARESTFFHHRVKPFAGKLFFTLFLLYMSLPLEFSPLILLLPMAIILSIFTMYSVMSYKKYA